MTQVEIKAKKFADHLNIRQPVTEDINPWIDKELNNFRKQTDKLQFLEIVIKEIQELFDHHFEKYHKNKDSTNSICVTDERYKELLFHLQDALDDLPEFKPTVAVSMGERKAVEALLRQILTEVNVVRETHNISALALAGEVELISDDINLIKNFLHQNRGSFEKEVLAKFFDYTAGAAVTVAAAPRIQQLASIMREIING